MAINYSWRIEDMQWDNSTGMVVSVNATYVGTFNGQVGSATTTITEERNKSLLLNSSSSPIGINTLTPSDVKGWLDDGFASELPTMQKDLSDALKQKKEEFYKDGEPSSGWIHCSYSRNSNRGQWLRAQRIDGKVNYQPWLE